ncbi:MAG: dihydroorotase [Methanomassiliicoccales archaeon]|nr:dihydroorotase [Methanomassiliicoccales archaeon]
MELVIEGRAYYKGKLQSVNIGVDQGRIVAVKKMLRGERHLDFGDRIILPGAIDIHTHMREPGMTRKEDFASGTLSAAFGGVTCIFDMPNTKPPTILRQDFEEKMALASRKAWTDFGLFGGCSDSSNPARIAADVVGFKIFMSSTTGSVLLSEDSGIRRSLDQIRPFDKVVSVHAEDEHLITAGAELAPKDHDRNRTDRAEARAIDRLASLGAGNRINVCHVTSRLGIEALAKTSFSAEATPHHMLLDFNRSKTGYAKINPPLRRKEDREAVLQAFIDGKLPILASDHAPHTVEEKEQEFSSAPSGCPGVETSFPLMLALTKHEHLPLSRLIDAACARPAALFGLNKGSIEVGKDADLAVYDPREVVQVNARKLHSKCGWTLFDGFEAVFPQAVFLRGQLMIEEDTLVGERSGRDVGAGKPRTAG